VYHSYRKTLLEAEQRFLDGLPPAQRRALVDGGFSLFDEISAGGKLTAVLDRLKAHEVSQAMER
jgi:hypothetical protein